MSEKTSTIYSSSRFSLLCAWALPAKARRRG